MPPPKRRRKEPYGIRTVGRRYAKEEYGKVMGNILITRMAIQKII
tara:strand:- start:379 stop:513 length:135 start_codon:yes stop_codon:yes gene_type:complete